MANSTSTVYLYALLFVNLLLIIWLNYCWPVVTQQCNKSSSTLRLYTLIVWVSGLIWNLFMMDNIFSKPESEKFRVDIWSPRFVASSKLQLTLRVFMIIINKCWSICIFLLINVTEYRRGNQIQRNWQHRVHKTINTAQYVLDTTTTNTNNVNKARLREMVIVVEFCFKVDHCLPILSSGGHVYYLTIKWWLMWSLLFLYTTSASRRINILCIKFTTTLRTHHF